MSLPILRTTAAAAALALSLALPGCGTDPAQPEGTLAVTVAAVGTPIAELTLEVSAADISPSLVFNLTVTNGTAQATVAVPAGAARLVSVAAFDSTGAITHEGAVTIDVLPGANPPLQIPLTPRPGQVPITVHVGPVSIAVSPGTATLGAGQTVQLTASVTAAGGALVLLPVQWASRNPALASVSDTGLVTAHAAGTVQIAATSTGAVGSATVTVTGP